MREDWCSQPHLTLGQLLTVSFLARKLEQNHATQKVPSP